MQCLAHSCGCDSVTRKTIQEIKQRISRIREISWGSLAAEKEMLDATPAAFHQGVPPSSIRWWPGDANLAMRPRTEPMQRRGVPRHTVTKRKVAREDTKEGEHKRNRNLQERHQGGRMETAQRRGLRCPGGPEPRRGPQAETLSAAGYGARAHSQATDACERT
jgi:hypothetical protein